MSDKLFICNVNLRDACRRPINANTPFSKDKLAESTFDALSAKGRIIEYIKSSPLPVSPAAHIGMTVPSISASREKIDRPKSNKDLNKAEQKEREAIMLELQEMKIPFAHNCRLATLQAKLKEAKTDPEPSFTRPPDDTKKAEEAIEATEAAEAIDDGGEPSFTRHDNSEKTDEAADKDAKPKHLPERVWDADPMDLEKVGFPILLSIYKEICTKYGIEMETFKTKEEVIDKLTSEHTK